MRTTCNISSPWNYKVVSGTYDFLRLFDSVSKALQDGTQDGTLGSCNIPLEIAKF